MKIRYLVIAAVALLLGGCASYGYRGGSGDYYYGQSSGSGYYGAPYGSVGYGTYGGFRGSVGYGYPSYYRRSYWPRHSYGYGYGHRGYYPGYYYGRPIIVRPRPDHDRPREDRPDAPWRNLQGVTRVEHRERAQRVGTSRPAGIRTQGQQRERIQPSIRPAETQRSRSSPWRAGSSQSSSRPERVRARPAPSRQSSSPSRQRATPSSSRRATPRSETRDSDRRPTRVR